MAHADGAAAGARGLTTLKRYQLVLASGIRVSTILPEKNRTLSVRGSMWEAAAGEFVLAADVDQLLRAHAEEVARVVSAYEEQNKELAAACEERNSLRAEVERLTRRLHAVEADRDALREQFAALQNYCVDISTNYPAGGQVNTMLTHISDRIAVLLADRAASLAAPAQEKK